MAEYVVVDKEQLEADITTVADAIREKGGTSEQLPFPNGMADAVRGIESGGSDYLRCVYSASMVASAFTDEKIVLNLDNINTLNSLFYAYTAEQANKCVKHITVNCLRKVVSLQYAFSSAYSKDKHLEQITLNVDTSECSAFLRPFGYLHVLKIIDGTPLNLNKAANTTNMFQECYVLEEVRFVEGTIPMSISFSNSPNLSDATRQSIIDGLADLTGGTAQTITFHKDIEAKLSEEQKAQITSKNWTLAFK